MLDYLGPASSLGPSVCTENVRRQYEDDAKLFLSSRRLLFAIISQLPFAHACESGLNIRNR